MSKNALVTGAGTGVGRAAALALVRDGWDVTLTGRRPEPLEAVAEEVRALGREALAVCADVGDPASVDALFEAHKARFPRLDLLFNNAGTGAPAVPVEDLPFEKWKAVVDANLTGTFLCAQWAFRIMKAQRPRGGRIINNGSISAYAPRPNSIAYTATKHAVSGITRTLSMDGRKYDIAVGQLDIGNAETDLAKRMADGVLQADGSTKAEPLMDAEHAGNAVAHMASLPLDANVLFMTVMATKMPFIGRG
ncbi:SDR family oxidoreductase [Saliniramus sp.]|uniref:SDR family oxidoreductase n=1 Tax=Saliniramus sp. TaxID=2986772 RepID=UPI002C2AFF30|nr:SDR family oxidoreductase [Saliniramus sp.]HMB09360.1 SDR family oxidoreductase [Saliniramus sp.]